MAYLFHIVNYLWPKLAAIFNFAILDDKWTIFTGYILFDILKNIYHVIRHL